MKKGIVVLSSFLIIAFLGIFAFDFEKKENPLASASNDKNKVVFDGKTDGFDSLKGLEDGSTIIIRGVKTEDLETIISRSEIDGQVNGGYTASNFKISQVYKNSNNNEKIKKDNNISILESAYYDEITDTTYSINGYENMIDGKEYLLFLTPETDGLFATRAVTFGKIPLDTEKVEVNRYTSYSNDNNDEHINDLNKIFSEAKLKYIK